MIHVVLYVLLFVLLCAVLLRLYSRATVGRCTSNASMVGKVVIVTGGNAGLGYQTAIALAKRGARVILACRSDFNGKAARDQITALTGNKDIVFKNLNLSSLDSVRKFAGNILESEDRLDVLVNNAGVHGYGDRYSEDGLVEGFQINHFGPFLLTLLLLPLLKKSRPSRIVVVSSIIHYFTLSSLEGITQKNYYNETDTYTNSKLCNLYFTTELAKRLDGSGVVVNAAHPGVIKTKIVSQSSMISRLAFWFLCLLFGRSVEEGAQTFIHLSVAEECASVTGKYYADCKESWMSFHARNSKLSAKIWDLSIKLTGYKNDIGINLI